MTKRMRWHWLLVAFLGAAVLMGLARMAPAQEVHTPPEQGKAREQGSAIPNDGRAPDNAPAEAAPGKPPGPMPLPADLPDPAQLVVIPLHDEVSLGMAAVVERVATNLGPRDILVLDINTFGGRVDAAVVIRDALLGLRERQAWSVAYIHPRAISAGALISFATDIIVVAPGATMGAATPVRIGQGGEMEAAEEKTVSYMRKEMRATAEARGRNGDIAEAMVDADVAISGLVDKGKLLTLDGKQALAWGVASFEAVTLEQLVSKLGYGPEGRVYTIEREGWSWAEKLAGFLSSSGMSGLLMTIGMLGLMIGLYTGGNPVPMAVGGICLGLFFFGHHVVDLAGLEEILLFALGLGLLLFEVLVPGHIVPGILGVLCIVASLLLGLVSFEQVPWSVQWQAGWLTRALATVFGAIAGAAVLAVASFQLLPATRFGRNLLLETAVSARATDKADEHNRGIVGRTGKALTDLRPAGRVDVDGKRYDAVAERGFIAAGTPIQVLRTRGFSVVVAEAMGSAKEQEPGNRQQPQQGAQKSV